MAEDIPKLEDIPSMYDEKWQKANQLGDKDVILDYQTPEGTAFVKAKMHFQSGTIIKKLRADCELVNSKTGVSRFDNDKFTREVKKLVFGLRGDWFQNISDNKSAELDGKMERMALEMIGVSLEDDKKITEEKNGEGPAQSTSG